MSKVAPYELPQVISQIPPPPMDAPMPIRKSLLIDGENKAVNYLICREHELNKTSWSKLQKKYNVSRNKIYATCYVGQYVLKSLKFSLSSFN